ncbi:hypothetical protein U8527_18785 [Kordia algicida OT-1]|uniref:Uncharacterized protein n=1 Tax=Kordia algicida OT-1 TaxID=391587 RepID=A9DJ80_9FLAO|nr:hypothetical protein [Kordia algicida]EDP98046.1 hypothetical protein KAOT1_12552 [Kordia algicida OT-1]
MKILIALFSITILSINSIDYTSKSLNNNITTYEVVFDGAEGGMLFFTDSKEEAITVKDEENKLFKKYGEDANSYVGRAFTMLLKAADDNDRVYKVESVIELKMK